MIIDKIYPHLISIGDDVIFSANVSVLAHDAGLRNIMGIVRIGHVTIGNRCFICSLDEYKQRIRALQNECPVYGPEYDPLSMSMEELAQQKDELAQCIGLKKAVNYKRFNSLE
jgi:hypothetical protein